MKRLIDLALGTLAAVVTAPLVLCALGIVWLEDRRFPLFLGERVGVGGRPFRMYKVRTMRVGAQRAGVHSTQLGDPRLLRSGPLLRRLKLDELPQFWNVVLGDMSLVGPRPNVAPEVAMYTAEERRLLTVRPGITDMSSIVFADLAEILHGAADPNRDYNRRVRPWKSRLGLHYVRHHGVLMDAVVLMLTALGVVRPSWALDGVAWLLVKTGAEPTLVEVARRRTALAAAPPPGASEAEWEQVIAYR